MSDHMSNQERNARVKRLLVPAVCIVTLLIPVLTWLISAGNPLDYFTHDVPPGQALFVFAKLCGLVAFALLWLQCMTALAKFSPALKGFLHFTAWQHALLGGATFVLALAHVGLFVTASSLRTGHLALSLLLPRFDQSFYGTHISYGAIAFWLLAFVLIAGAIRMRRSPRWRWVHRAAFLVFGLALLHGTSIGSETRFGLMRYVYAFIGFSFATALCSWIWISLRERFERARRRAASALPHVAPESMASSE